MQTQSSMEMYKEIAEDIRINSVGVVLTTRKKH